MYVFYTAPNVRIDNAILRSLISSVNSAVAQSHVKYEYDVVFTRRRVNDVPSRNYHAIFYGF